MVLSNISHPAASRSRRAAAGGPRDRTRHGYARTAKIVAEVARLSGIASWCLWSADRPARTSAHQAREWARDGGPAGRDARRHAADGGPHSRGHVLCPQTDPHCGVYGEWRPRLSRGARSSPLAFSETARADDWSVVERSHET